MFLKIGDCEEAMLYGVLSYI